MLALRRGRVLCLTRFGCSDGPPFEVSNFSGSEPPFRVLERYPNNGRLLKVYGRFLEYCKNDPWCAGRLALCWWLPCD